VDLPGAPGVETGAPRFGTGTPRSTARPGRRTAGRRTVAARPACL